MSGQRAGKLFEQRNHLGNALTPGKLLRSPSPFAASVRRRSKLQQASGGRHIPLANGVVQRRETEFPWGIDVGASRYQHLYGWHVTPNRSDVEGPIVVVADFVHTYGARLENERVRNGEQQLLETRPLP